jgi:uncharacterized membrane protein
VKKLKKAGLVLLIIGYLAAGLNHFRIPAFYIAIIPPYLPHPEIINIIAGCCEIGFAVLLIFAKTREFAAWGIVFMLIAFIPVHMEMVRNVPYRLNGSTVSPIIAWIRLLVIQPLLIWWAWWYTEIIRTK